MDLTSFLMGRSTAKGGGGGATIPVFKCNYYQENYGEEEFVEANMEDSVGIIEGLIAEGYSSREIFNLVMADAFGQELLLTELIAQIMVVNSETDGATYLLRAPLISCGAITTGEEEEKNFTLISGDFFNPAANAWQYATIYASDGEASSGIPITVVLENSADKYQDS